MSPPSIPAPSVITDLNRPVGCDERYHHMIARLTGLLQKRTSLSENQCHCVIISVRVSVRSIVRISVRNSVSVRVGVRISVRVSVRIIVRIRVKSSVRVGVRSL